ncbi:MAG: (d)CMP kinase [Nitrospirota bacterium]|nr:(d)CMP kinase [Nitrospirota bacterium]
MKGNMKKVIAIDGPSGAGKSTIAKLIAKELGFDYLDTGALYRAVALVLRETGLDEESSDDKLREVLAKTSITFKNGRVFINDRDVSDTIRSAEIDHFSSVFSARKIVRDFLHDTQRKAALSSNIVVEGRDTTTVLFPDAVRKIFLDASVEERAHRRYLQFKEKGIPVNLEDSRKNVIDRDMRDSSRLIAPLKKAPDALFIDSSNLSIEQVFRKIQEFIRDIS